MRRSVAWLTIALITALPSASATPDTPAPRTVSWEMLRDALERSCCLRGSPERYAPTWLDIEGCESVYGEGGDPTLKNLVNRVNRSVTEQSLEGGVRPVPVDPGEVSRQSEWPVAASRDFARRFIPSPSFQRIVLRRVYDELDESGIECTDCPPLTETAVRRVGEDELMRYVSLYAWPDRVRPVLDQDGSPTGEGSYSLHICSGLNGLNTLDDPDEQLASAAGIIAFRIVSALGGSAKRHLEQVLKSDEFKEIAANAESPEDRFRLETTYLRQALPPLLSRDEQLRTAVRSEFARLSKDTGLDLE